MTIVKKSIKQNRYIIIALVLILVVGVIKASFDLIKIKETGDIVDYINTIIKSRNVAQYDLVITEFLAILKILFLIWLCGSSIVGIPVILYIIYKKGYIIGFCSGMLIKSMGINGLKLITVMMVPKEIFIIPIMVIIAINGIRFSINIVSGYTLRHKNIFKEFGVYVAKGLIYSIISLAVILLNISIELHLDKVICLLKF